MLDSKNIKVFGAVINIIRTIVLLQAGDIEMKEELSKKIEALTEALRLVNESRKAKQEDYPEVVTPHSPPPVSVEEQKETEAIRLERGC